jgi:hypothetical protein
LLLTLKYVSLCCSHLLCWLHNVAWIFAFTASYKYQPAWHCWGLSVVLEDSLTDLKIVYIVLLSGNMQNKYFLLHSCLMRMLEDSQHLKMLHHGFALVLPQALTPGPLQRPTSRFLHCNCPLSLSLHMQRKGSNTNCRIEWAIDYWCLLQGE